MDLCDDQCEVKAGCDATTTARLGQAAARLQSSLVSVRSKTRGYKHQHSPLR